MPAFDVITRANKGSPLTHTEMDSNLNGLAGVGVYVGSVMPWFAETTPPEWLHLRGQELSRSAFPELFELLGTTYGDGNGTTTFNLPDTRGLFLRGKDDGAEVDPDSTTRTDRGDGVGGDNVGSKQEDEIVSHGHILGFRYTDAYGVGPSSGLRSGGSTNVQETGGNETRPKNIYVNWIIKAY